MVLSTDGAARLGCRSACARGAFGRAVAAAAAMMIAAGGFMAGAAEEAPRAKDTPRASQPNQMPRLGEPFEVLVSEAWPALVDGALRKGSGVVRLGDGTIAAGYFDSAGSFNVMTSQRWRKTVDPYLRTLGGREHVCRPAFGRHSPGDRRRCGRAEHLPIQ